jgi:F-type H+-transporting ATPase subunit c
MPAHDLLPLAVALLIGIPALGSCLGVGMAAMKMLESSARQPADARTADQVLPGRRRH